MTRKETEMTDAAAETPSHQPGEIKTCPRDREPVLFTFEFPGAEYFCVECGWTGGIFDAVTVPATREQVARHTELSDRYEIERATRTGLPVARTPRQDVPAPVCGGCGVTGEGRLDHSGKPAHWYSRTRNGVTEYACSRECIGEGMVLPW